MENEKNQDQLIKERTGAGKYPNQNVPKVNPSSYIYQYSLCKSRSSRHEANCIVDQPLNKGKNEKLENFLVHERIYKRKAYADPWLQMSTETETRSAPVLSLLREAFLWATIKGPSELEKTGTDSRTTASSRQIRDLSIIEFSAFVSTKDLRVRERNDK